VVQDLPLVSFTKDAEFLANGTLNQVAFVIRIVFYAANIPVIFAVKNPV